SFMKGGHPFQFNRSARSNVLRLRIPESVVGTRGNIGEWRRHRSERHHLTGAAQHIRKWCSRICDTWSLTSFGRDCARRQPSTLEAPQYPGYPGGTNWTFRTIIDVRVRRASSAPTHRHLPKGNVNVDCPSYRQEPEPDMD